ncbi:FecR family protein [Sphingomonas sp. PR090111-T3T-6A]|uniref:FecR family protein n=1 Tax=Sphingomonas sp. PR090111-T3T-6A TaxID=685778 RepID=UPI00037325B5|nr:FecR domain-containing protein [Sphingomonas sp. PR090111-T3T-6A]
MPDRFDEAAAWALKQPLGPEEQVALEQWLALDPRHSGALLRAMAGLSLVDAAIMPEADDQSRIAWPRRRIMAGMAGALAASFAGVIGWRTLTAERVSTARGEIRRLPLSDGSVATIDTDSELRVAFAADTRRISLDHGQAWFQVAKDRTRPFVVDAGIAQARAVGTAFSVERREDGVDVAVTEGVVAVWPSSARGEMTILEAGQFARFRPGAAAPTTGTAPAAIERTLAWRSGEIALENETVAIAVARFNRYNRQQLVLADPSVGEERLIGLFQIDRPEDFAATLAATLDVAVTTTPDEIRLAKKTSATR